ncbi:MAG TPA: arylamine N-acetyltransferase [Phycisphaerales bacterium]|nr:arylamine N-acetyltransferase [Phycisphaerales bacterium]
MSLTPELLDAYFSRIHYTGGTTPTLDTLRGILVAHATTVPFENLDVLLGRPLKLDTASLHDKLVTQRRGGYCFEQNSYLLEVFTTLGFHVTPLAARVRLGSTRDITPPRTHVCLQVDIAGVPWLADCGVGSATPVGPLRLDTSEPQPTSHETHRIVWEHGKRFHQVWFADATSPAGGAWTDVYEFTGEAMPMVDREIANWWTSTHPESKFRNNVLVARVGEGGTRRGIQNRQYIHRKAGAIIASREISDHAELVELLARDFGIVLPAGSRIAASNLTW